MKIYEYARERKIKSRDVVRKLHEMGFDYIKNHLSLVPEKVIEELDAIDFKSIHKQKPIKKIAVVSMECAPFVNQGLGELVKNKITQNELNGHEQIIILPKHQINEELTQLMPLSISIYHKNRSGYIYQLKQKNITYYFVDSEDYFNREKLYGYYDDAERYAFLEKAALKLMDALNIEFDIINIHDWSMGLFPLLFKESLQDKYPKTKLQFSVYGCTYQGIYGREVLTDVFELDNKHYPTCEYAMSVNFLKTGLVTADQLDINKVAFMDLKKSYLKTFIYDN